MYKSTDAGASWAAANTGLPGVGYNVIAIDPTRHATVYAGVYFNNPAVYRSSDGGTTWSGFADGLDVYAAPPRICGGIAGFPCPTGEVCDLRDPTCRIVDLAGTCVPRPQACIEIYDPVCGCDRVTYGNDCLRLSAGATLAHAGACN